MIVRTFYGAQRVSRPEGEYWLVRFRGPDHVDARALVCVDTGNAIMPSRIKSAALAESLRECVGMSRKPAPETEEPEELGEGPEDLDGAPGVFWRIGAAFRFLCVAFVLSLILPVVLFVALTSR